MVSRTSRAHALALTLAVAAALVALNPTPVAAAPLTVTATSTGTSQAVQIRLKNWYSAGSVSAPVSAALDASAGDVLYFSVDNVFATGGSVDSGVPALIASITFGGSTYVSGADSALWQCNTADGVGQQDVDAALAQSRQDGTAEWQTPTEFTPVGPAGQEVPRAPGGTAGIDASAKWISTREFAARRFLYCRFVVPIGVSNPPNFAVRMAATGSFNVYVNDPSGGAYISGNELYPQSYTGFGPGMVIAVAVNNYIPNTAAAPYPAGLVAHFTSSLGGTTYTTNVEDWKCLSGAAGTQPPTGWAAQSFDDSAWSSPAPIARNANDLNLHAYTRLPPSPMGVNTDATWIWADDAPLPGANTLLWCRFAIPRLFPLQVRAASVPEGGVEVWLNSVRTNPLNGYSPTDALFATPGDVVGIFVPAQATPSFIASITFKTAQYVSTPADWRCWSSASSAAPAGWSAREFNDSLWTPPTSLASGFSTWNPRAEQLGGISGQYLWCRFRLPRDGHSVSDGVAKRFVPSIELAQFEALWPTSIAEVLSGSNTRLKCPAVDAAGLPALDIGSLTQASFRSIRSRVNAADCYVAVDPTKTAGLVPSGTRSLAPVYWTQTEYATFVEIDYVLMFGRRGPQSVSFDLTAAAGQVGSHLFRAFYDAFSAYDVDLQRVTVRVRRDFKELLSVGTWAQGTVTHTPARLAATCTSCVGGSRPRVRVASGSHAVYGVDADQVVVTRNVYGGTFTAANVPAQVSAIDFLGAAGRSDAVLWNAFEPASGGLIRIGLRNGVPVQQGVTLPATTAGGDSRQWWSGFRGRLGATGLTSSGTVDPAVQTLSGCRGLDQNSLNGLTFTYSGQTVNGNTFCNAAGSSAAVPTAWRTPASQWQTRLDWATRTRGLPGVSARVGGGAMALPAAVSAGSECCWPGTRPTIAYVGGMNGYGFTYGPYAWRLYYRSKNGRGLVSHVHTPGTSFYVTDALTIGATTSSPKAFVLNSATNGNELHVVTRDGASDSTNGLLHYVSTNGGHSLSAATPAYLGIDCDGALGATVAVAPDGASFGAACVWGSGIRIVYVSGGSASSAVFVDLGSANGALLTRDSVSTSAGGAWHLFFQSPSGNTLLSQRNPDVSPATASWTAANPLTPVPAAVYGGVGGFFAPSDGQFQLFFRGSANYLIRARSNNTDAVADALPALMYSDPLLAECYSDADAACDGRTEQTCVAVCKGSSAASLVRFNTTAALSESYVPVFSWNSAGRIPNRSCLQITALTEPTSTTWYDNFLCAAVPYPLASTWQWSTTRVAGLRCTLWYEPADAHWPAVVTGDKTPHYLCGPNDARYEIAWSYDGTTLFPTASGWTCTLINESADGHGGWDNNYLCVRPTVTAQ